MKTEASENTIPTPVSVRNSLAPLIERYAMEEGVTETQYPGLSLGRFNKPVARYPLVYSPSVCVVAQGRKHVYSANERVVYDPQIEEGNQIGNSICTSSMNEDLLNTIQRLLQALETQTTRRILGPGAVWEILYHVLKGEQGAFLRSMVLQNGGSKSIMRVVRYLHKSYNEQHNIASIARYAGMSTSTLHHAFEKLVGQSPIQYLKKIRLHQARLMIVGDGSNASEAANEVGYNSASQFSREFKRQFGLPPSRAAESL